MIIRVIVKGASEYLDKVGNRRNVQRKGNTHIPVFM